MPSFIPQTQVEIALNAFAVIRDRLESNEAAAIADVNSRRLKGKSFAQREIGRNFNAQDLRETVIRKAVREALEAVHQAAIDGLANGDNLNQIKRAMSDAIGGNDGIRGNGGRG